MPDPTPGYDHLYVKTSTRYIPLNEFGSAELSAVDERGYDRTGVTRFYINDEPLEGNIFHPSEMGEVRVKAIHEDLESEEISLFVEEPLNRKTLLEYVTGRTCGICPWPGHQVDSMHHANDRIVGYSIHLRDELALPEIEPFLALQGIYGAPNVRLNRTGLDISGSSFIDYVPAIAGSTHSALSSQPPMEIALSSTISGDQLEMEVSAKFYQTLIQPLYLTVVLVEDKVIINNQANAYSGYDLEGLPYSALPDPIPEYETFNVAREYLTDKGGEEVDLSANHAGQTLTVGTFQTSIPLEFEQENGYLIAFLHKGEEGSGVSSVFNTQIAPLGVAVDFKE